MTGEAEAIMGQETLVGEPFGSLRGVKIISTGRIVAQPFAAELAAELGAEVFQIEQPGEGDAAWRTIGIRLEARDGGPPVSATWIQERRNIFCISLDLSKARGREIFLRLVSRADILMESSKPGTYQKWNLDDPALHNANRRLVIAHVSGYGQTGAPGYIGRASYDFIGQAFGGMMNQTGFPDNPPTRAAPWTGDYLTAYMCFGMAMAGLLYARSTGQGQVIDVAQFEAIHHTLGGTMIEYFHKQVIRERSGNKATAFQPYDTFAATDGWVAIGAVSWPVFERVLRVVGLDTNDPKWRKAQFEVESMEGIEFDAIFRGWVSERSVAEVVKLMNDAEVACIPIMNSKDLAEDPHYKARAVHTEWDDDLVGRVKGIGVIPKFSLTPGKIWRGCVRVGHDNQRVYQGLLGISDEEMRNLEAEKII